MRKWIGIVALVLALGGCATYRSYEVVDVREAKVYEFEDGGRTRYIVISDGKVIIFE